MTTKQFRIEKSMEFHAVSIPLLRACPAKIFLTFRRSRPLPSTHKVSGALVSLKWLVQQNITVVIAAYNPAYFAENIDDLCAFELTDQ